MQNRNLQSPPCNCTRRKLEEEEAHQPKACSHSIKPKFSVSFKVQPLWQNSQGRKAKQQLGRSYRNALFCNFPVHTRHMRSLLVADFSPHPSILSKFLSNFYSTQHVLLSTGIATSPYQYIIVDGGNQNVEIPLINYMV